MKENISSEMLKMLFYMNEMECEEISMKTKDQEMTVLLTERGKNDNIKSEGKCAKSTLSGKEGCAKSNPPEEGAHDGDIVSSSFPGRVYHPEVSENFLITLLNILPYDTVVEWETKTGKRNTDMIYDITGSMIDSFPNSLRITYMPDVSTLVIEGA